MNISGRKHVFVISLIMLLSQVFAPLAAAFNAGEIQNLVNRKDYKAAVELVKRELSGLKGNSLMEAKIILAGLETDPQEAARLYTSIVNSGMSGNTFSAVLEMAKISYATGRYRDVVELLDEIPSGSNSFDRLEALFFKGLALKEIGDSERAFVIFESIDRGKYVNWSCIALAELDMQYGRVVKAVERFETIAGSHSNPVAGFRLGECYEILGDREKALNAYKNLARLFPESLEAPQAKEKILAIDSGRELTVRRNIQEGGEREESGGSNLKEKLDAKQYYTLQFGAFSVRNNAEILLSELTGTIDDLKMTNVEREGKTWYRIRAGKYSSREKAEAAALRIKEKTGYSSRVLPSE